MTWASVGRLVPELLVKVLEALQREPLRTLVIVWKSGAHRTNDERYYDEEVTQASLDTDSEDDRLPPFSESVVATSNDHADKCEVPEITRPVAETSVLRGKTSLWRHCTARGTWTTCKESGSFPRRVPRPGEGEYLSISFSLDLKPERGVF